MKNNKTFTSISSDNNLFDLNHIFRQTVKDLGLTPQQAQDKVVTYVLKKYPHVSELTAPAVATWMMVDIQSLEKLSELMDALGCKINIGIEFPSAQPAKPTYPAIWDKKLYDLDVPVRVFNVLQANGIYYVGQVVQLKEAEVLRFINMGRASMGHLKESMRKCGLVFGQDTGDWQPPTE